MRALCAWEVAKEGDSRGFFLSYMLQGVCVHRGGGDGGGGSGGDGSFFVAIELIDHLLFPVSFKEVNV